jgi:hypothetical protein
MFRQVRPDFFFFLFARLNWKRYDERASFAEGARYIDFAAVCFNEAFADRQAETHSLRFRGEKGPVNISQSLL